MKEEFDTWDREAHFHAEDDLFIIPKTSKDFVSLDSIAVTLPKIKPSPELVTPSGSKGKIPTNFPPIQTPPSSFERLKPHMKPFARSFPETNLPCSPHYKRGSLSFQDFEANNDGDNNHPIVSRSLRNILTDDLDQAEDDFETTRSKLLPSSQLPADYSLSYQQAVSIRRNIRPALERMQAIKTIEPLSSARTSNSRYTSSSSAGSLNSTSTTNQQFGDDEDIYLTVSSDEESGNESDHSLIILRAKKKQSDSSLVSTTSVSSIVLTEIETSPFASCNSSLESVVFRSKECKLCNLDKLTSHPQCPYNHCLSKSAVVEKGSGAGKKTNQE